MQNLFLNHRSKELPLSDININIKKKINILGNYLFLITILFMNFEKN